MDTLIYALLDVGIGGAVIFFGGIAAVIFIILAVVIISLSVKHIRREIKRKEDLEKSEEEDSLEK
ncbi:MAG: hypothetical protein J6X08_07380 [Lachnospiraceae bacterium]|nr:hypothetical protein [Lachnospiraceae bacterium]